MILNGSAVNFLVFCLLLGGGSLDDSPAAASAFAPVHRRARRDAVDSLKHALSPGCQARRRRILHATVSAMTNLPDGDAVFDALIVKEMSGVDEVESTEEDMAGGLVTSSAEPTKKRKRKRDMVRDALRRLATLSLEDYKWRSAIFKTNEADRLVEESMAKMMGEDPSYVRPMDASVDKIGPLGTAEKNAVDWLSKVIEEEGKRAQRILNLDGKLVRPIDLDSSGDGGPLSELEKEAVNFVKQILDSENERWSTGTLRPKDLDETKRGPLGEAEEKAVTALERLTSSEMLRMEQTKVRGGELVRPLDVPGPLGEFEKAVLDVVLSERQRVKDREQNEGKVVRPKDASVVSSLGDAERRAMEAVERLKAEETDRLASLKRALEEKRPMEANRDSPLGFAEAMTVGILRAPQLIMQVVDRVKELMQSEPLDGDDQDIIQKRLDPAPATSGDERAK